MPKEYYQAGVFDPATNTISVYSPLVIDKGDHPLAPPVVPTLPAGAVVATWFGYNGNDLTLRAAQGDDLKDHSCVNGSNEGVFGQFSYCNAPAFFNAANAAIASGKLKVPAQQRCARSPGGRVRPDAAGLLSARTAQDGESIQLATANPHSGGPQCFSSPC